jgi:16S rRNA processing protein RimM
VGKNHGATILVPFTHDVVPVIDLAAGRIEIDPPEGLLEPVEDEPTGQDGEAGRDD